MSVEQMSKKFSFGAYETRWYPGDGKLPAQWRLFRAGNFVFSAPTLVEVERFARGDHARRETRTGSD